MAHVLERVDHSILKTNQAMIIGLNILAFILNAAWLGLIVTLVMLVGTLFKKPGFGFIYKYGLKPLRLVNPDVLMDNPEPHRFAQGLGSVVMLAGVTLINLDMIIAGWGMVWLVVALAALNLFAGFCVGCFVYYWLNRINVPGFKKSPPQGTFPGARPKGAASEF